MSDPDLKCPTCGTPLDFNSCRCAGCGQDVTSLVPTQAETSAWVPERGGQSHIGEFRIIRLIGRGGIGSVYEAWQESMHRRVALKVLNTVAPLSSSEASRFEREAWIAGGLNHPNIVKVYGQGVVDTTRYIAMELVEGKSLAAAIQEAKRVRSPQLAGHTRRMVALFVDLADALQHVHERHIIHRDIKPSNLLLLNNGSRLLLTDFGLARDDEAGQLTRRGDLMGTVRYMSPEQLLAQRVRVDHRTDIWSLGVSLYEAATLELPYSGDTEEAYIGAVSMKDPIPARTRDPAVPRDLETVLMKCLQRDPEQRYRTAAELKDDLARFVENRPVLARRPGVFLRTARFVRRHRLTVGAASLAALLTLAVLGGLLSWRRHQSEMERIRWTLQQVIANPKTAPSMIQPDLIHLQNVLQQEVRRNPRGDLALLAQRAACRVTVDAPSFGLLSALPDLTVIVSSGLDPGRDFLNVVYVEGALDNGPWEPIGSVARQEKDWSGGFAFSDSLDRFFPAAKLTPTPHEIQLRATYRLFDTSSLSSAARDEFSRHETAFGPLVNAWPAARNAVPFFTETRALEPVTINLFTQYPKDFPRAVLASQTSETPLSWFHLERLRIIRVQLPPGTGTGFGLEWPLDKAKGSYCAPKGTSGLAVVGVEFFGRMEPHFPLAANAVVWSDRKSKALLSFPFAWSEIGQPIAFTDTPGSPYVGCTVTPTVVPKLTLGRWRVSGDCSYTLANFAASTYRLPTLPDGVEDGTTSGRIDFIPSRSIAVATGVLDRYFGENTSIPISRLEIITVPAKWISKEGCH